MTQIEHADLCARWQAGDERSLELLLCEFAGLRRARVSRAMRWGHRPVHIDRDDLLAVALEAAVEAAGLYDGSRGASVRTYLAHRIDWELARYLLPFLRLRRQARTVSLDAVVAGTDGANAYEAIAAPETDVSIQIDAETALACLDGIEREIVEARFLAGMSHRDIAICLSMSKARVAAIEAAGLAHARLRLRAGVVRRHKKESCERLERKSV